MILTIANTLVIVAGILWSLELIPQVIKTYKTKSVKDISPLFFYICFTAYILYLIGTILMRAWALVISHMFSFVNIVIMLFLITKYRKRR
jgi:MtN3 and saliva related transmembrane protein